MSSPVSHQSGVDGYELVRISDVLVDWLLHHDSEPIVVVGLDRQEDGTCELVVRRAFGEVPLPLVTREHTKLCPRGEVRR